MTRRAPALAGGALLLLAAACASRSGDGIDTTAGQAGEDAMSEGFVTSDDGVRLFFQTRGHGSPALVMPNGTYLLPDLERLAAGRTVIAYDPRHRGRSDRAEEGGVPRGGVARDVADLEAVRAHFGLERIALLGHSYAGMILAAYALDHGARVERMVLLAPMEPRPGKTYPAELSWSDEAGRAVMAGLGALQASAPDDPVERCERFWAVLRPFYVADPADAARIDWGRCHLRNEREFLAYWTRSLLPSLQAFAGDAAFGRITAPVLIVHGRRDRSAPYGGAREWATLLPNARLLTVARAAHAPWVEDPDGVPAAIETFLAGAWPGDAEAIDPQP